MRANVISINLNSI